MQTRHARRAPRWLVAAALFGPTSLTLAQSLPGPVAAAAAPLFGSHDPMAFTLEADLKAIYGDRDSLKAQYHPATLWYVDSAGARVSLELKIKTRGHWRRKPSSCEVPPLRLNFKKEQTAGSLFAGQNKLDLTLPCRSKSAEFEQYVLREYLVYRVYNLLTPISLRVRLARVTYVDRARRVDTLTKYSFLVEDEDRMAERHGGTIMDRKGARFHDLEFEQIGLVSAFEYLIGGTDWSVVGLHNIRLVQTKGEGDSQVIYPVPYDFDFTGIVATRYAVPDYRLPIKSVVERLYRGHCRTPEQWPPLLARFVERKDSIYALYDLPGLDRKYADQARKYLDGFYRLVDNPGAVKRDLVGPCRVGA